MKLLILFAGLSGVWSDSTSDFTMCRIMFIVSQDAFASIRFAAVRTGCYPCSLKVPLRGGQSATSTTTKWHFGKTSLFYSLHINDISELYFPVHYILISLVYGRRIRRDNRCFRVDAMSHRIIDDFLRFLDATDDGGC